METNNKASTSRFISDSSDEEDEHHGNLSTEESGRKIKKFRNSCLENEINVNNSSSKSTTRIEDDNPLTAVEKPKVNLKVLNGPKEWKPQAMAKALKSCTPNERKDIISNSNINGYIDDSTQQNIKQTKTFKNLNQVKSDIVKIDWLNKKQICKLLKKNDQGKNYIPSRTLKKWNPLHNILDTRGIVPDIVYKFNFLKYAEIKPNWWISHNNCEEDSGSETSNSYQNKNDCSQTMEIDYEVSENLKNKNHENVDKKLANLNIPGELNPEDENVIADIKTESKMDTRELKKEISDIVDEQCVETNMEYQL